MREEGAKRLGGVFQMEQDQPSHERLEIAVDVQSADIARLKRDVVAPRGARTGPRHFEDLRIAIDADHLAARAHQLGHDERNVAGSAPYV